jgi:putative toxin-antitoxin system antitoxin component (TIGR02293 family)
MKQPRHPLGSLGKRRPRKPFVIVQTGVKSGSQLAGKAGKSVRGKLGREVSRDIKGVFDTETGLSVFHGSKSGPSSPKEAFEVVAIDSHGFLIKPEALKALKNYSDDEIHNLVVPKRTLARRQAAKEPLSVEETDKAVRLGRIDKMAEKIFGDASRAHRWLRKPKRALGGDTPLAYLATEAGARAIEEMLNQIDHGIIP